MFSVHAVISACFETVSRCPIKRRNDTECFILSLLKISQKPFSPTCWYVYFNFKFHFFDMSWPPNCPYHAWRPLAGPLKVGRCSLSRHSLVQLIHHKRLQRFKDFEVAGYQLECQRLTDPTKSKCEKKQRRREKEGDFLCVWGEAEDRWSRQFEMLFRKKNTWNISIYLDTSRFLEGWNSRIQHASPFPTSLDCFSFGFGLPWPLGLRLDNQVRFVWLDVFLIYISPETWSFFKGCLRMFEV